MNVNSLEKCPLFAGVSPSCITPMMGCLKARERFYGKNEFIYHTGDSIKEVGIILSGKVRIIKEDIWGNGVILAELDKGMLFVEAFVYGGAEIISVSVLAAEKSNILFLDSEKIASPCNAACPFHFVISKNMMKILASKNIFLTERVEHLSKRTLKEKVLSYLSGEAARSKSLTFEIPFSRQELADYLAADRSALSAVLGKLRDEGMIEFHKNKFTLKTAEPLTMKFR